MASNTLIATLRAVTGELAFTQPSTVLSSQVLTDIQLKQLAVAACDELMDMHNWQALMKTYSFTVHANQSLYDLPADYQRMINQTLFVGKTAYDGSPQPLTWGRLQSGEKKFRIIGDKIEIYQPETVDGQTCTFTYISKYYVLDGGGGIPKPEFTLDSDKTVFAARLFTNLVKLKLLQTKNMDTLAAAEDFNAALQTALSTESPAPVLYFGGEQRLDPMPPWLNAPYPFSSI